MFRTAILASTVSIFATAALAADIAPYEPTPTAYTPAFYDWSGAYVGLHAGLATGDFDYEAGPYGGPAMLDASISGSGFIGGGQVGYDFQSGAWVFGAVADIAFSSYSAEVEASMGGLELSAESELKYLGTVRGRIGRAFDRALFYGHGGLAYGETEQTVSFGPDSLDFSQTRLGWTIGAGMEYALTDRVSFGTEYSYVDLGSEEIINSAADDLFVEEDLSFHTIKALVNFRF